MPLTRLLIQWRSSRDNDTWYNYSDQVQGSSETRVMRGLNAWSDISFRVIAINKYGRVNLVSRLKGIHARRLLQVRKTSEALGKLERE